LICYRKTEPNGKSGTDPHFAGEKKGVQKKVVRGYGMECFKKSAVADSLAINHRKSIIGSLATDYRQKSASNSLAN